MRSILLAACLWFSVSAFAGLCSRFPDKSSSAFDSTQSIITLPWRTDFPTSAPSTLHAWQKPGISFNEDWISYIEAVLSEVRASGIKVTNNSITMPSTAPWWITPWMDVGRTGREPLLGLTTERSPDPGDLSPNSAGGLQTLAIGWYNAEGAVSLGEVFRDPCDPKIPMIPGGARWTFKDQTASFKFLFTTASIGEVKYLIGAPTVQAMISGQKTLLRLLQVDVAVRDPRAADTSWVFGTFVWIGPPKGDGLFDNLVPVGLMWGNDPGSQAEKLSEFATLHQSELNSALAGQVWQAGGSGWSERPFPGFQGRLNGPADNWRSSCMACHAAAQYPRNQTLGAPPRGIKATDQISPQQISAIFARYFVNVQGGHLIDPQADQATPIRALPLDYSLQLQTAFTRICEACASGDLSGTTPTICRTAAPPISTATCPSKTSTTSRTLLKALVSPKGNLNDALPRQ
ncbi:hypothetical protein P3T22_001621 [Paraburkholderia sp. GAS348]